MDYRRLRQQDEHEQRWREQECEQAEMPETSRLPPELEYVHQEDVKPDVRPSVRSRVLDHRAQQTIDELDGIAQTLKH